MAAVLFSQASIELCLPVAAYRRAIECIRLRAN